MFFHRRIELIVKFFRRTLSYHLLDILDISFVRFNERQVGHLVGQNSRQLSHIVI
jgi:hypothetical protein